MVFFQKLLSERDRVFADRVKVRQRYANVIAVVLIPFSRTNRKLVIPTNPYFSSIA
jgi:hypothetical protein